MLEHRMDGEENDMGVYRLGKPDDSSSDFIRREDLLDVIDDTDWYHMYNGEIVHGANEDDDDPLYKIDEIIEAIKNLPRRRGKETEDFDPYQGERDRDENGEIY